MMEPCEVCWTVSWVPIATEADAQGVNFVKDANGLLARCDHCWLHAAYDRLAFALWSFHNEGDAKKWFEARKFLSTVVETVDEERKRREKWRELSKKDKQVKHDE